MEDDTLKKLVETDRQVETLRQSWALQDRDERRRRMFYVRALILELEEIKKESNFATELGSRAIESVIEGNKSRAKMFADLFSFENEKDDLKVKFAPLWAKFKSMLEEALEGSTQSKH